MAASLATVALLVATVALLARAAAGGNIVAVLTTPTPSHHIWSAPLMAALAARGHNLTVLSPTAMKPPVPGITDLVLEGSLEFTNDDPDADYEGANKLSPLEWLPFTFDWYVQSCNYSLHTKGAQALLAYPDDFRVDLVIIEATGGECLLGVVEKFGRPAVVAVNGFGNPQWINWNGGNLDHPAYVANALLPLSSPPFAFADTLYNSAMYAATYYHYYYKYLPAVDDIMRKHFGTAPPPVWDTLRNVSLTLVNAHYSVDGARPFVPSSIPVGGLQIKAPKPLPKDLQEWLDGAPDGAIFFSLGSLVRSDRLGERQRACFLQAFARLPRHRVLWKWESDGLPEGTPPNVRIAKWLPQSDILAHPKVRVFLSHSGMLSTHEAVWRGVPVVALPFIVDQFLNARRLEALGVARRLDYATLTPDAVSDALQAVLGDPGYRQRMLALSSVFRSRPSAPLDTAVFWVEHALRHRGAPRMRCPSSDLPWYRALLLDVAAVAVAALAAVLAALWAVVALLRRQLRKRRPTEVKEKAQ